jgi:hypothetical protein
MTGRTKGFITALVLGALTVDFALAIAANMIAQYMMEKRPSQSE